MKSLSFGLTITGVLISAVVTASVIDKMNDNHNSQFLNSKQIMKSEAVSSQFGSVQSTIHKTEKESNVIFNDPAIKEAWGIGKVDAQQGWQIAQGSRKIVVAIIDTGADVKHEDLVENIWENPGETGKDASGKDKAKNGIDDDGNGFIDDVHGWNFVSNNSDLKDNHGHGTHIAGIIGASGGNNKGIIGIAPKVSMMILKYYDPKVQDTNNLKNTIEALKYAVKMNANIINYSGGGTSYSQAERDVIEQARKKGILVVAAAGNEKSNSDFYKYYPADYGLSNIISVTAFDPDTKILSSSNWGTQTVDVAAPGEKILSTFPDGNYGYLTGTSQATAFVSGAAAVLLAHQSQFTAEMVKKHLIMTGDSESSLLGKTRTARKLNLYKALTVLDSGVSATGVVAVNTYNMKNAFVSDPNASIGNDYSPSKVSQFGKSLLESIEKAQ